MKTHISESLIYFFTGVKDNGKKRIVTMPPPVLFVPWFLIMLPVNIIAFFILIPYRYILIRKYSNNPNFKITITKRKYFFDDVCVERIKF
jgi:hypothetical protein